MGLCALGPGRELKDSGGHELISLTVQHFPVLFCKISVLLLSLLHTAAILCDVDLGNIGESCADFSDSVLHFSVAWFKVQMQIRVRASGRVSLDIARDWSLIVSFSNHSFACLVPK